MNKSERLEEIWKKLSLLDDKEEVVTPRAANGKCSREDEFNAQAMRKTLAIVWKPVKGVNIRDLEGSNYLFQFYHEMDLRKVLDGGP